VLGQDGLSGCVGPVHELRALQRRLDGVGHDVARTPSLMMRSYSIELSQLIPPSSPSSPSSPIVRIAVASPASKKS